METIYKIIVTYNKNKRTFTKSITEVILSDYIDYYELFYDLHLFETIQNKIIVEKSLGKNFLTEMKQSKFEFDSEKNIKIMAYFVISLDNDMNSLVLINRFKGYFEKIGEQVNLKDIPLEIEHSKDITFTKNTKRKSKYYYITINDRFLVYPEEYMSYDYKDLDEFETEQEYVDYMLPRITASVKDLSKLSDWYEIVCNKNDTENAEINRFPENGDLDKYTFGEHFYWQHHEWENMNEPSDIFEIKAHFERLFPNERVEIIMEQKKTHTKTTKVFSVEED